MKQYEVLVASFIGNQLRQPGDVVAYDGEVGDNLKPVVEEKAPRRSAKADADD